uniref:SAC domain-containing protein n=1 Tax=Steinernema glaseri TaxID=37863 RepID=A0A1I7YJ47_9BILA
MDRDAPTLCHQSSELAKRVSFYSGLIFFGYKKLIGDKIVSIKETTIEEGTVSIKGQTVRTMESHAISEPAQVPKKQNSDSLQHYTPFSILQSLRDFLQSSLKIIDGIRKTYLP